MLGIRRLQLPQFSDLLRGAWGGGGYSGSGGALKSKLTLYY